MFARKLQNIKIEEVSLVDAAANRKRFHIVKRSITAMDKIIELLKKHLGDDAVTEEMIAKVKTLKVEAAEAISKAIEAIAKYREDMPDELAEAFNSITKAAVAPDVQEAELTVEKIGARFSKATKADLLKVKEIIDGLLKDLEAAAGKTEPDPDEAKKRAALPADIQARLRKLDEMEAADAARIKKEAADRDKATQDRIAKLEGELAELKKSRTPSAQPKPGEGNEGGETVEKKKGQAFHWGSLLGSKED